MDTNNHLNILKSSGSNGANNGNSDSARHDIEQAIESIIEHVRRFIVTIEEYQSESQSLVFEKINSLVHQFEELDKLRHGYNAEVPFEIFDFIDQGRNPDLYIKESLDACLNANGRTKGKLDAIQTYKNELESQMAQLYPEEYEEYKELMHNNNNSLTTSSNSNNHINNGNNN